MGARPTADRSRSAAIRGLLTQAAALDRSQSDPVVALRNAVGVGAPLVIGVLAGNVGLGLASAVGALQTAFADRPGPYRLRMVRMIGTAVAAAITSALAVLASRSDAAAVLLLLVLAFLAGLLLSGGPSATQVGVAGVATALVLGHLQQPASDAAHIGLLVLAGGAGQALLAVAAWPVRRHRPERIALAGLYRELAASARTPEGTQAGPPAGDTLSAVRRTLYGLGHDHGPSVEAYRVLLDEAERLRREIVVVIGLAERLAAAGNPILAGLVRQACAATGSVLDAVADALAAAQPVDDAVLVPARKTVDAAVARLRESSDAPAPATRSAAAARLRALSGQVRAAVESTRAGASEGSNADLDLDLAQRVLGPLPILRSTLALDSAIVRHAGRLAVLVAGADLVVRLAGIQRGYWVALTVVVVLRPDFGTTLQRAVMRTLGTIVGLLVASALVRLLPGGGWWDVALILVFAFAMRFAGPGNIGLSAVALSGLVVVLLEISGVPANETLTDRSAATLAGGALAVLATLALPAWERHYAPARLVTLLRAYADYVTLVGDLSAGRDDLQAARLACRLARTNAQASVDRVEAEPAAAGTQVELGRAVLSHTHRFIHAALAVDALRAPMRANGGVPALRPFLQAVAAALRADANEIDGMATLTPLPALRPLQEQIAAVVAADPASAGGRDGAATLVDATDRIANSVDTLRAELRRQRRAGLPRRAALPPPP